MEFVSACSLVYSEVVVRLDQTIRNLTLGDVEILLGWFDWQ